MPDDVVVRDARPGDGPGLAQVWLDAARLFRTIDPERFRLPDQVDLAEWFDQVAARPRDGRLYVVAEVRGEVAGKLAASLHDPAGHHERQVQTDLTRRTAHIDVLAVAERHRRRGVGRALVRRALQWAHDGGAAAVTLETDLANPSSMAFYEKTMGFERTSVVFRKSLRRLTSER